MGAEWLWLDLFFYRRFDVLDWQVAILLLTTDRFGAQINLNREFLWKPLNQGLGCSRYPIRCWQSVFQNFLLISLIGWWNLWHPSLLKEVKTDIWVIHDYRLSELMFYTAGVDAVVLREDMMEAHQRGNREQTRIRCWRQILPIRLFSLGKTLRCCTKDIVLRII